MKTSDLPDADFLAAVEAVHVRERRWAHIGDLMDALDFPPKILLSKAARLIKRGLLEGCTCGCRGDFEIPGWREWRAGDQVTVRAITARVGDDPPREGFLMFRDPDGQGQVTAVRYDDDPPTKPESLATGGTVRATFLPRTADPSAPTAEAIASGMPLVLYREPVESNCYLLPRDRTVLPPDFFDAVLAWMGDLPKPNAALAKAARENPDLFLDRAHRRNKAALDRLANE